VKLVRNIFADNDKLKAEIAAKKLRLQELKDNRAMRRPTRRPMPALTPSADRKDAVCDLLSHMIKQGDDDVQHFEAGLDPEMVAQKRALLDKQEAMMREHPGEALPAVKKNTSTLSNCFDTAE